MFGFLKKSGNHLYEFVVPVTKGAACRLNIDWELGKVVCYAAGSDEDSAKQVAIQQLQIARCVVEAGWQVREVDPKVWGAYIKTRWPRSAPTLPNQEHVTSMMKQGGFFFGPPNPNNG
jgi:hypothetical protein